MKKDIENKEEIYQVVQSFYAVVRKDALLAPIFNKMIPESQWDGHLNKITDFWSSIVFNTYEYFGDPMQKHIDMDKSMHHVIDQSYFDRWLDIWYENIDRQYMGINANTMKDKARNIAHIMWIKLFSTRKA